MYRTGIQTAGTQDSGDSVRRDKLRPRAPPSTSSVYKLQEIKHARKSATTYNFRKQCMLLCHIGSMTKCTGNVIYVQERVRKHD